MKQKIMTLVNRPFVRNVFIMASGTAAAQAVALALTPIITRLYGPEAYGLMGVFMAIIQTVAPVAALTYPLAIVLPERDMDAKRLMQLGIYIAVGLSLFSTMVIVVFDELIVQLFRIEAIEPFLLLIPLVILFSAFLQTQEQWLVRTHQFAVSAKAAFLQALVVQGGKAGIGVFYPIPAVLIVLTAMGNGVKALLMVLLKRKFRSDQDDELSAYRDLAQRFRDFPSYRAPQVLLNGVSQNIPVLLLSSFFGPASAGFYSLGRTVLSLPIQLIGKSAGDVFYPRVTEAKRNNENVARLIGKATLGLAAIGVIPFGIMIVLGPWLFSFVFGADWGVAGEYARWMSLWIFFIFINQPAINALPVLKAQGFFLKYSVVTVIIRTGAMLSGYALFADDVAAIASFSAAAALLSIGLIVMTLRIARRKEVN
ncbi:Membrane protein involved in the export of O-antigen and teichoic acid [Lentibacillus persicus]|uniref:Membrane protein involved in the export of O-antigen and teichoic acid n=1 Tax=Lentibacillus persicus TaxID=640948 RepID=A0A1I1XVX1_9BACI|nr:oligosaccharide flippase family protein [Lentibacillus persicus]SFE11401.1 Membrane protein involved in the export of O-antigen and teichoic acid [Lentibacillus persicus]